MDSSLHAEQLETCGVRIPLRRMDHPDSKTTCHTLPEDCAHFNEMWREKIGCDVVIEIGEEKIKVHKMLTGNWDEAISETIKISTDYCGFGTSSFIDLLQYLYTGVITIDKGNVQNILQCSEYLENQTMMYVCASFMVQRAMFDDVLPILFFLRSKSYDGVDEKLYRIIDVNFVPISKTEEFGQLPLQELIRIIQRDSLNIDDEKQIFEAITTWIGDDIGRIEYGMRLMKHVRIPLLCNSYVRDIVMKSPWIVHFPEAANIISEAKIYHLSVFKRYERVCDEARKSIITLEYHERLKNYEERCAYERHPEMRPRMNPISIYDPINKKWIKEEKERRPHPDMPTARVGLKIFFIGFGAESGLMCNTEGGVRWTQMPSLSLDRSRVAIAVIGSKIFAAGGGISDISSPSESSAYYYDTSLNSSGWTRIADMNIARTEVVGCSHNGFFYVIGGGEYIRGEDYTQYAHGERYDSQANTWKMIAPMYRARGGCSAISFNGRIYVAGGHYNGERGYVAVRTVEAYDPNTDQWERLADLTIQRQKPTLIVSDGKLMVMGGYEDYWERYRISSVEEYDKDNNTWKERREMQSNVRRASVYIRTSDLCFHSNGAATVEIYRSMSYEATLFP